MEDIIYNSIKGIVMVLRKSKGLRYFVLLGIMLFLSLSLFGCSEIEDYIPEYDPYYSITHYDVNIDIDDEKVMHITETVTADFYVSSRGITRYLPLEQTVGVPNENGKRIIKNYEYEVENFTVLNTEDVYLLDSEYAENGIVFYIAAKGGISPDYDEPIIPYTFSYSYDYYMGDDRIDEKDFVYFNIVGTEINTNIENLTFSVTFPKEFDGSLTEIFVGRYGEGLNGEEYLDHLTIDEENKTISGEFSGTKEKPALLYGEAVTLYQPLEQGYFVVERSYVFDIVLLGLFLFAVAMILILYFKHRRKDVVVDVVEFSAPDGITPTEAGYLYDKTLDGEDISALIVYWASKGYVQIEERGKSIFAKKLKDLPPNAKKHEQIFFSALFNGRTEVDCGHLNNISPVIGQKCKQAVEREGRGLFLDNANKYFNLSVWMCLIIYIVGIFRVGLESNDGFSIFIKILIALVMFLPLFRLPSLEKKKLKMKKGKFWFLKILYMLITLAGGIGIIIYAEGYCDPFFSRFYFLLLPLALYIIFPLLEQYTKAGREYLGRLNGLKQYIEVTEKDKMEMMVKDNPEMFYKILPYAYVLGVSKVYMEKFKDVPLEQPKWLTTTNDVALFTTLLLLNHNMALMSVVISKTLVVNIIKSVAKIAAAATISSIGDGGGGGFSGGGSGGGGIGRF